jgi:pullulanase
MADRTPLPSYQMTSKGTQSKASFALFNDNFRNAIKGDNDGYSLGFAQGNLDEKRNTETGIAGSVFYDEARIGFTQKARETINYVNSHDNLILQDKLLKVFPQKTEEEIKKYNKFIHSILFLSQGIPFIHSGNEFLRSKNGHHNTYNAPLSINAVDWSLKEKNIDVFNYIKDLIEFRKSHSAFRLDNGEEIRDRLKFFDHVEYCPTIAYTHKENGNYILVVHNANSTPCLLTYQILKKHIDEKYKDEFKDMTVDLIFDEHGIVRNNTNLNHANGVQTQAISTYAYKVKTIR